MVVKLTDLDPVWLSPDVFMFRNPTGGHDWLTCKRVAMSRRDQAVLVYKNNPHKNEDNDQDIVLSKPEFAWSFTGNDFATLTVTPSIDASASGNWHGFITNGEIR